MKLTNFAVLASLVTLTAQSVSAANVKVADPIDASPADVSAAAPSPVSSSTYVDVELLDPSASNGTVNVKVPLPGFSKELYSSLVAGSESTLSSAACIPPGSFCTWGYWDCCGTSGCLLLSIAGGVCV
ncbi:MAG: hypothetical protein NXY57DRAFT_1004663 [Lentinula lateritia]|uniref:Uncharacterized protein n=1 Tax=Lentinula lateritia TaxID=40482 RepID=A0ABQ8VKG8_9AGAR|nr:MAG: hypothetical protein NXY57DRAFT_1004663 [Lentinula lateritia]KAJ4496771.1 hypothetical protein C8R41DRAFT_918334 [Lentinula lateritia]